MVGTFLVVATLLFADAPPAAGVPSPGPTPIREIVRVRAAGGACRMLNTLVSPVAEIFGHNDDEFVALRKPLARFAGGGAYDLATESLGSTALAAPGEGLSGGDGDDPDVYSPERTMAASNIDRLVGIIQHNLDVADRFMKQSLEVQPRNTDPATDALRQRVQNVIDLQRVLAFRLDDDAGTYFSNSGVASLTPKRDRVALNGNLVRDLAVQIANDATDPKNSLLSELPKGDVAAVKHGSASEVAMALRIQKLALSIERERARRACDASASSAPPSPSP